MRQIDLIKSVTLLPVSSLLLYCSTAQLTPSELRPRRSANVLPSPVLPPPRSSRRMGPALGPLCLSLMRLCGALPVKKFSGAAFVVSLPPVSFSLGRFESRQVFALTKISSFSILHLTATRSAAQSDPRSFDPLYPLVFAQSSSKCFSRQLWELSRSLLQYRDSSGCLVTTR